MRFAKALIVQEEQNRRAPFPEWERGRLAVSGRYPPLLAGEGQGEGSVRHRGYASRGQALILSVLVMFVLAGLAGVFIALINDALIQTVKAEERAALEKIAQAGLQHARMELNFSPDGADWRPDEGPDRGNPGWIRQSTGFYRVAVTYGPTTDIAGSIFLANPLERLLRIDVEARFSLEDPPQMRDPNDPASDAYRRGFLNPKRFISRKLTAFVPIGLTDYLYWITNRDGTPNPAALGIGPTLDMATLTADPDTIPDDQYESKRTTVSVSYMSVYDGPIRSEVSLELGTSRVDLTNASSPGADAGDYQTSFAVRRADMLEVIGKLTAAEGATATVMVNYHSMQTLAAPSPQRIRIAGAADSSMLRSIQTRDNNPLIRSRLAPRIDRRDPVTGLHRYRALTRDAGEWKGSGTAASYYHTGAIGWGEGMYINNPEHIQHNGDLDALRAEWLDSSAENWQSGVYDPRPWAVELILHDWEYAGTTATAVAVRPPYIELRRADGQPFYNWDNAPVLERITMPYPRNGVIFAEGNLIVKGTLPASSAFRPRAAGGYEPLLDAQYASGARQVPGGWYWDARRNAGQVRYYVSEANRRYDLTIVSGGTIYVEGNLLGPASRHYQPSGASAPVASGSEYDSKLALLAMDYVCLNPTRLFELDQPPQRSSDTTESFWRARAGQSVKLKFTTAGPITLRTRILLRHAGETWTINPLYAVMRMLVNGAAYQWDPAAAEPDKFYFCDDTLRTTLGITTEQWSPDFYDPSWTLRYWGGTGVSNQLYGYGAENVIEFEWLEGTTDYLLNAGGTDLGSGFVVTPSDLQVDALIFAQRGSWFIIPGRFYNEDPGTLTDLNWTWPLPKYHEPLDVRITINGAIVENRPAPPEAQQEWLRRWCGWNLRYYDTNGDGPDMYDPDPWPWSSAEWRWPARRLGVVYHYDATLGRPVCFDIDPTTGTRRYRHRLPKLPVSPDIFSFSEMSSG